MILAEASDVIWAAPLAYVFGVITGLAASSRWLIVRRERGDR